MASCILTKIGGGQIEGTAVPANVLSGKTFMSANSDKVQVGTMIDKRNQNPDVIALTSRNNYLRCSVPTGYYENSGIDIPLSNLGTVSAANVLSGQTFTSTAGLKQTGTMPRYGTIVANIKPGSTYTIPSGFHEYGTVSAYLDNLSFTNNNSTMSGGNSGSITVKEDGIYIVTICGIIVDTGRNDLNDVPVIKVNNVNKSSAWTGSCSNNEGNSAWGYARATIFCLKLKTSDTISWSASRHYGCTHSILKINSI